MNWLSISFSIALFFTVALCYNASCPTCYSPSNPYWTMQRLLQDPLFYLLCVITPVTALLPRYSALLSQGFWDMSLFLWYLRPVPWVLSAADVFKCLFQGVWLSALDQYLKSVLMSGSVLLSRYFYRACQGTLFPSPVQVGRQLDKLPAETRRNILSLSRVKVGSPLSPEPPFLSLSTPPSTGCTHKDQRSFPGSKTSQGPVSQTEQQGRRRGPTDSERGLSDLYTLVPTEIDTLPYTKDAARLSEEPQPPQTQDSECLDRSLEASDLSLSGWITSTPLLTQTDSIHLNLPPDGGGPHCVRYTRDLEEKLKSAAQRSEQETEHSLHVTLWYFTVLSILLQFAR